MHQCVFCSPLCGKDGVLVHKLCNTSTRPWVVHEKCVTSWINFVQKENNMHNQSKVVHISVVYLPKRSVCWLYVHKRLLVVHTKLAILSSPAEWNLNNHGHFL